MKPIIEVKNLRKVYKTHKREQGLLNAIKSLIRRKYETKEALKGVSFTIKKGEVVDKIVGFAPEPVLKQKIDTILAGM